MWSTDEMVVISDLHLAAEYGRGLFQADAQLAEFLRWVHKSFRRCHLLLNGDAFDFLAGKRQEPDINLDAAASQAAVIVEKHKEVFDALSLIANSKEHELIIIGGNHDPELAFPTVQRQIEERLKSSCLHPPTHWMVNGEAALFQVGGAKVLIEHGDQYDSWNWIDHEALRRIVCLASRNVSYQEVYTSPPGSHLVINRFNHIGEQFPWLQTLQPLSASILPLALEVILPSLPPAERSRILDSVKEFRKFTKRSVVDVAVRNLNPKAEYWADDDEELQLLDEWLATYEREEDSWSIIKDIKAAAARAARRLRNVAARRLLKRVSRGDTFFKTDKKDGQHAAVERLIDKGTNLVIHGHTHSAKAYKVGHGLYINTGTWGQLMRLPNSKAGEKEWTSFIETLRAGRVLNLARLTFARVSKREAGTHAALFEWVDGHPEQRSGWLFANGRWESEDKP